MQPLKSEKYKIVLRLGLQTPLYELTLLFKILKPYRVGIQIKRLFLTQFLCQVICTQRTPKGPE